MAIIAPVITEPDVHAIRAVMGGAANSEQQLRAMRWIMNEVCRRLDSPWRPGPDGRETDFESGRHWCGIMIGDMTSADTLAKAQADDLKRGQVMAQAETPTARTPRVNRKKRQE